MSDDPPESARLSNTPQTQVDASTQSAVALAANEPIRAPDILTDVMRSTESEAEKALVALAIGYLGSI